MPVRKTLLSRTAKPLHSTARCSPQANLWKMDKFVETGELAENGQISRKEILIGSARGHSFSQLYIHIVFSTKRRLPFLRKSEIRRQLHPYLATTCKRKGCTALAVGGTEDHVHLLIRLSRTQSIANIVRDLKRASSHWLNSGAKLPHQFRWQKGYGAFSIAPGQIKVLMRYIENQMEHHATISYKDEIRRICQKFGVEIDEEFMWE